MFLLPPFMRRLFQKKQKTDDDFRVFSSDQALVTTIREIAQKQGRAEEEVLTELARAGQDLLFNQDTLIACWDALSAREQEVLALVCLGYRNYEIAELLAISHQTIKTHLQNIFNKFDMRSAKELRRALQGWGFQKWWQERHS